MPGTDLTPETRADLIRNLTIAGWLLLHRWAKARQEATGQPFPVFRVGLGVVVTTVRGDDPRRRPNWT